ncbi:glycosyl transferase [Longibacter salinarum]|uniref:Glycosyl transferase n=1 Tax=Longibacter salinarum TaxID=1850348 RepID=A0A2A8CZN7_9BACT|nr:glycosyltransferase [Longibacter salinarum]PEN14179.1 glycosyl transferase [Longibacter salinarum]
MARIAVVGPVHPYRGGIAHFTEMTVEVLARRGHDVRPISFSRQYPEMLFPGKTQYEPDGEPPDEVSGAPRLIDSIRPWTWAKTAAHLARLKPDAVIFQYWMPFFAPAYGLIARWLRRKGIPSLALVHNALPHERHLFDAQFSRFFLAACDSYVVMSDAVAADVRSLCGEDAVIEQIEHPVYERFGEPVDQADARRQLHLPDEAPVLLFFGFIREYKGLHILLEAMPRIRDAVPEVRLVIAGEVYDDPERYRALIRKHELEEAVDWHNGYIPGDEVPVFFGAADLVVQPYVSATQSGVAQIAFHFETPMVVTDVGGLAEIVPDGEAGLVVPPENPDALADAVIRFVQEDLSMPLQVGARRQKQKHAPDRLGEAVERLLN